MPLLVGNSHFFTYLFLGLVVRRSQAKEISSLATCSWTGGRFGIVKGFLELICFISVWGVLEGFRVLDFRGFSVGALELVRCGFWFTGRLPQELVVQGFRAQRADFPVP